jgi:tellurite resistance protein TehA-like permease
MTRISDKLATRPIIPAWLAPPIAVNLPSVTLPVFDGQGITIVL